VTAKPDWATGGLLDANRFMLRSFNRLLRQFLTRKDKAENPSIEEPLSDIAGFVETLNIHDASGWAVSRTGAKMILSARLDNISYPLEVAWSDRTDVAQHFGQRGIQPGYVATFPLRLRQALSSDLEALDRLSLICNGEILVPYESMQVKRPASVRPVSDGIVTEPIEFTAGEIKGSIEGIDGFTLHLNIRSGECGSLHPSIVCSETQLDCSSAFVPAPGTDDAPGTLEVELPGYIWEHIEEDGQVRLQVSLGEHLVPSKPLRIEHKHAASWLVDIANGFFGEQQYWALLGLEHLHFLGDDVPLDSHTKTFFVEQAAQFGLDEYVEEKASFAASSQALDKTSSNTLILWQALREFNAKLPDYVDKEPLLFELTLERFREEPEQQTWLIYSLIPFFCRIGKFPALRTLLSPKQIEELSSARDDWRCTLALPYLAASGDLQRAGDILNRLHDTDKIWLNTECIAYATQLAIETPAGDSGYKQLEIYAYSLIHLLDQLSLDYWSRLHDKLVLDSLTCWFEHIDRYSTWLREDLCKAVVRLYGLNPLAWSRLHDAMLSHPQLLATLHMARRRFDTLRNVLEDRSAWPSRTELAFESLAYFRQQGNKDAENATRELSCSLISEADTQALRAGDQLSLLSGPDYLRLAAYPAREVATSLPEHRYFVSLQMQMASLSERSHYYPLQHQARNLLRILGAALAERRQAEVEPLLRKIHKLTTHFRGKGSRFLAAEILSQANLLMARSGQAENHLLSALGRYCHETLTATENDPLPPAALLNAVCNLRLAQKNNPATVQQALLGEIVATLANADEAVTAAIELPENPVLKADPNGDNGDTLVVIYSCRKYLDTRIPAIRSTWIQDLVDRGIPYVIMVGDGDDRVDGDLLALNVSDRYEDLPLKTLKLFDWIRRNTDFQYAIKIDDDCYLDVDRYFDASSHRKHHYYGRILHRRTGDMDRTWHQDKSQGQRARRALDKSPEPSAYADGSTGYCLSRLAMECLHRITQTTNGKRLISSSYMEDKMLGDLLRMANIRYSDEDFYTSIRRRTFSTATTIAMWESTFLPGGLTPTKVTHLDTDADMATVHAQKRVAEVLPKRIWPTYEQPTLHYSRNQLELLSPVAETRELLRHELVVIVVVRNEIQMLPHFLDHYRKLGVHAFVFIDNASDDGTREALLAEPDVVLYSADTEYKNSHYGVAWQQAVLGNHCVGKWALIADADELLVYPECERKPIQTLIERIEQQGHDSARVFMIDMYPYGDLDEADFDQKSPFAAAGYFDKEPLVRWHLGEGFYSNARNYTSALRHRLIETAEPNAFMSQKFALLKYQPWMRLNQGLHNVGNINPMESDLSFAHFKYHAGFKRKIQIEIQRKQHFDDAKEYRKYRELLAESSGGFGQVEISDQYRDSSSFNGLTKGDRQ